MRCCGGSCARDDGVFDEQASESVGLSTEDFLSLGSRDVELEGTGAFNCGDMKTRGSHLDERAPEVDLSFACDWLDGKFHNGLKGGARRSSTGLGVGI